MKRSLLTLFLIVSVALLAPTASAQFTSGFRDFLRADQDDTTSGELTALALKSDSNAWINYDGPEGDGVIYFYENSSPVGANLKWSDGVAAFEFSHKTIVGDFVSNADARTGSNVYVNYNGGDGDAFLYFYEGASETGAHLKWDDVSARFEVSAAFDVTGDITVTGTVDGVDVAALNTDVAGDSTSWNATADALGTAITSDKITNQTIAGDDIDSTAENFVFDDAYKGTSAVGDSVLTTRKEIGDTATAIRGDFPMALTNQGVKGDHVDSTGENFVFDGAYHVTSATSDSAYVTIETLEDTAALRGLKAGETWTGVHDYGGATSFELPNSANPTIDAAGEISFDSDENAVRGYDGAAQFVVGQKLRYAEKVIVLPDSVQAYTDAINLLTAEPSWAPFGIEIVSVGASRYNVGAAYVVNFENWGHINADSAATAGITTIEAVTIASNKSAAEDDGTIGNATIAAGSNISVDLPTTHAVKLTVWATFYIITGD